MTARQDLELARDAERTARRLAERHPDPKAQETYRWIAERAAAREEDRRGPGSFDEVNGVHLAQAAQLLMLNRDARRVERQ